MKKILLALALATPLMAQQPKTEPKPSAPAATITAEQRAVYWKAQAQAMSAEKQLKDAQDKLKASIEAMKAACGSAELVVDQNGEPTCKAK